MEKYSARSVFFVRDAELALKFYTEALGFSLDWNYKEEGRAFVFQVSLSGFELILNQSEPWTKDRPGHGRVFIGLNDSQVDGFRQHLTEKNIETTVLHWGSPTIVVRDLDQNEIFVWLSESEREKLKGQVHE